MQAVKLSDYYADFSLRTSTTFQHSDLVAAVLRRQAHETIVYSVIDSAYVQIALNWVAHLRQLGIQNVLIVSTDADAYEALKRNGVESVLVMPDAQLARDRKSLDTGFASDFSIFVISLKFHIARELLNLGVSALFSDVDAIWLSNPHPVLAAQDGDVLFQVGSFPEDVRAVWGFTACTGFMLFRNSAATRRLLDEACRSFVGDGGYDDQMTLNRVLCRRYAIQWSDQPPDGWQHCAIDNGWTIPIHGSSDTTNLRLVALPHAYFQRHHVCRRDIGHAVICHPNSPKNEPDKIEVLRSFGLWHSSVG
jgi:Nucleotide-diphospho-sugar transferase